MAYPYNSDFTWPFPGLPVTLYPCGGTQGTSEVSALVDTGSDATLVPVQYLQEIGSVEIYPSRIRSHWGEWRPVDLYMIDLEVAGQRLPAVTVVGDDQGDSVLLGRNVLNLLILLLDGPRIQIDVLTRRPLRF